MREWLGGHPVAEDRLHAEAALDWLARAQDATQSGGVARGYSLTSGSHLGGPGWQPAYPETTGYIIPTLYLAAEVLDRPELRDRARRAAEWEVTVQMPSGAVPAGVLGESDSPAVFNTGQVLLGYLSAYSETGDEVFTTAARRAGTWLVDSQGADGLWRKGNSPLADAESTLYNARVGWALSEAGALLGEPTMTQAASRNLRRVASLQHANGWLPNCCLSDPTQPLLHTLAYAIRGLLEGGRVLSDSEVLEAAVRGARALAEQVRADGRMAGRFTDDWRGAVGWSCLTGEAQMANVWLRLHHVTGDARWLEPVRPVLTFLKRTQNRSSANPGLRGGIKGAHPVGGRYGRYQILNWATKFFLDALLRQEWLDAGGDGDGLRYVLP
ncbi:MAG: hypothetical protein LJF04_14500 [Gemmatimonadetes bacterium]|nr:hypothetical protein [Gemmatimonadota bacterium]